MAMVQRLQQTSGNPTLARLHVNEEAIVEILEKTSRVPFSLLSRCFLLGVSVRAGFLPAQHRMHWM